MAQSGLNIENYPAARSGRIIKEDGSTAKGKVVA